MLAPRPQGYHRSRGKAISLLSPTGLVILAFFWVLPLAACGGSSHAAPSGPSVSVIDNEFVPKELYIKAGQTVTWVNNGQTIHTVTADDNSFDSGNFATGAEYTHTFTQPGRYAYFCKLHGASGGVGMAGVIVVDATSSTGALNSPVRPHTGGCSARAGRLSHGAGSGESCAARRYGLYRARYLPRIRHGAYSEYHYPGA